MFLGKLLDCGVPLFCQPGNPVSGKKYSIMAENGFTNLGENFDKRDAETVSEPVDEGRASFPSAKRTEPTEKSTIHTDENGITCIIGL